MNAGRSYIKKGLGSKEPNLIAPALVILTGSFSFKASKILSTNVLKQALTKIYQVSSKFQKVAGEVIS
jgi:hypothetical protein